jgi:hypothetical protein
MPKNFNVSFWDSSSQTTQLYYLDEIFIIFTGILNLCGFNVFKVLNFINEFYPEIQFESWF